MQALMNIYASVDIYILYLNIYSEKAFITFKHIFLPLK